MSEAIALVCKTCGRDFVMPEGKMLWPCPGCSTAHSRPRAEKRALADLRRAHQQRSDCDFVNAAANYQRVLNAHPDEAEALWGLALCKYGVEFVQDEKTGEHLPVIHFLNRRPFTEDPDCRLAMEKAGEADLPGYQKTAAYIARIQQEVLAAESQGREYDVFLCYKGSVPGAPDAVTREYQHALQLYTALREEGYSVFFAHMTLRRAAGANYEAQIFQALQSARVMLVVVSEPAYLNTPWVQSEWRRYLERVDAKDDCRLVPLLYDRCDPYNLPDAFQRRSIQGLAMDNVTALDDLRSILEECIPDGQPESVRETVVVQQPAAPGIESLLRRATLFLEDGNWASADEYCEKVLDIDPECARAYVGKLMAALRVTQQDKLRDQALPFDGDPNYKKALRFADEGLAGELRGMIAYINERNDLAMKEALYQKAAQQLADAKTAADFDAARACFDALDGYRDAASRAEECETARLDWLYREAEEVLKAANSEVEFLAAQRSFIQLGGHRDAVARAQGCETARLDWLYEQAESALKAAKSEQDITAAQKQFAALGNHHDAPERAKTCEIKRKDLLYNSAMELMRGTHDLNSCSEAIHILQGISEWRDAAKQIEVCRIEETRLAEEERVRQAALEKARKSRIPAMRAAGRHTIAAGGYHTVGLQTIGKGSWLEKLAGKDNVVSIGGRFSGRLSVRKWTNIIAVAAGEHHTVGLRADGTVIATGDNDHGECDVAIGWTDIVAVAAGSFHTVGLRADGTVIAVGLNEDGECDVTSWTDIVAIAANAFATVGLRANGTVVAVGFGSSGNLDIGSWTDIIAIASGCSHTVGLRANGTVVAVGANPYGELDTGNWTNIVAIAAGNDHTIGLRADGTVVAVGSNNHGQCDVTGWTDIVAIAAGGDHTVGLRTDGSVVAVGNNKYKQCNVSTWRLKTVPRPTLPR